MQHDFWYEYPRRSAATRRTGEGDGPCGGRPSGARRPRTSGRRSDAAASRSVRVCAVTSSTSASSCATSAAKSAGLVPAQLLIDLRPASRIPAGHGSGQVQRDPLDDRPLQQRRWRGSRASGPIDHAEGVAQMADHLVRRHPSPAAGAVRAHAVSAAGGSRPCRAAGPGSSCVARARLSRSRPSSRSPPASRNAASACWRPASASASSAWKRGIAAQRVELPAAARASARRSSPWRPRAAGGRAPARARRRRRAASPPGRWPPGRP